MRRAVERLAPVACSLRGVRVAPRVTATPRSPPTCTCLGLIAARPAALSVQRRLSSTSTGTGAESPVNVEAFTLNEEVVKRDMAIMARWNELAEAMDAARAAGAHAQLLAEVHKGLAMLEELGAAGAPIQCESLLCLEGAQAQFNVGNCADALALARRARNSLTEGVRSDLQDRAQVAEVDQLIGFILLKDGKGKEAHEVFQNVLQWIDVDSRSAMPMQAVAAINLRRSILTGLGKSLVVQAAQQEAVGNTGEAKELFAKGLDILIESLDKHIDENDFQLVKDTLEGILCCFEGLRDVEQAVTTCRKYVSWCSRHEDSSGVERGKEMLADLCKRHGVPNPMVEEKESQK